MPKHKLFHRPLPEESDDGRSRPSGFGGLTYADLCVGDLVEIHVLVADHVGWEWERREVLAVDYGGGEDSEPRLIVRFLDPVEGREYDVDSTKPSERYRLIRRWEPMGYCDCGAALTLHFYPRHGPAPGNMKVCTSEECRRSLAGMTRAMDAQVKEWREKGLMGDPPDA